MVSTIAQLSTLLFKQSMREYDCLPKAMSEIKFIQYDPIRKPLQAQDLILLQRVKNYKPRDLETYYPNSAFEEDILYVYGILSKKFVHLLHPRPDSKKINSIYRPSGLATEVWDFVCDQGEVLSRDVANVFGRKQVTNNWGGKSTATTRALEELHYHGFIRVSKRINGNKVYQPATIIDHDYSPEKRLCFLTLLMIELLSPVSEAGLRRAIGQLCAASGGLDGRKIAISSLLASGEIECHVVGGVRYYLLAGTSLTKQKIDNDKVRFLAPFDPVVWDRKRFEHLWGWTYRFEAYMPLHLRSFGYYALPMFWRDQAIGWVNITKGKDGKIDIDRGFAKPGKYGRDFERLYEQEVSHFEEILNVKC